VDHQQRKAIAAGIEERDGAMGGLYQFFAHIGSQLLLSLN
jgi:hypothetical protein